MSRGSVAGNSVIKAVVDICGLYGVPVLRMQSRTFTVAGVGGKERPFFVGEWVDANGATHRRGMADLLLQPTINLEKVSITVPLWVEGKAGSGKLEFEQKCFRDWVESIGAGYICVTDSCEELMQWFKDYGVKKP
jgi:hypothetical protein